MYRIIGLDPGGTTGWASVTVRDPANGRQYFEWRCGHLEGDAHHSQLYNFLGSQQVENTFIVCESFEYRNDYRPGLVIVSGEYIGVTKLFSQERGVPLWMQTASQGKVRTKAGAFVKPDNLKRLGLWSGTTWRHAMDAYGHILFWMLNGAGSKIADSPVDKHTKLYLLQEGWRPQS